MELRLFVLAFISLHALTCFAADKDDTTSPNAPVITRAKTKVSRANQFIGKAAEPQKKIPKFSSMVDMELLQKEMMPTVTTPKIDVATEIEALTTEKVITTTTESSRRATDFDFNVPEIVPLTPQPSIVPPGSFMKFLQSLGDIAEMTTKSTPEGDDGGEVEHHGRFARGVKNDEEEYEFEDDSTPLTPSLEDALARLANAPDDHVVSFESETITSAPTPPPTAPAWARVPLYFQGAGSQLRREPSPPALVNPALTSVPSNAIDLNALLAMMLRSYPSSPSPVIPNLLFPSIPIVNRGNQPRPPSTDVKSTAVNTLFGKNYSPPKVSPDLKSDDKDGSSKELDPAESSPEKVSAKKPDDNEYEYEYVYYYYDEDDPTNKTMVVKPASAVKPKTDQKSSSVPALLPRQPTGPSVAEGRSIGSAGADNNLSDQIRTSSPSPLLTPLFTTPYAVKAPPLPFVQGPQSPVMFLGIQREPYQGPRIPSRTHPSKEPADLYAFSRAFEDQTPRLQPLTPFTYRPGFPEGGNEDPSLEGLVKVNLKNTTIDDVNDTATVSSKLKTTTKTTKAPKRTTTTEKPTTSGVIRGRRPTTGRKTGKTTTPASAGVTKGRRPNNRRNNQRRKGKETTPAPTDEENEETTSTEKPARGGRRGGNKPARTRTTSKPGAEGTKGRRKTTRPPRTTTKPRTTTASASGDETTSAASATTAKRLSNLFPRRRGKPTGTTTPEPTEEDEPAEEDGEASTAAAPSSTVKRTTTAKSVTTTTPTTTTSGNDEEQPVEEVEHEAEAPPLVQTPKSPLHRLRPLRPALRLTTTQEPDSS